MNKISKIISLIRDPDYRFNVLADRGMYDGLSDEEYIKRMYKAQFGHFPNLDDPKTYTEKLQWNKLYDHRQEYIRIVDKYEVKDMSRSGSVVNILSRHWECGIHLMKLTFKNYPTSLC